MYFDAPASIVVTFPPRRLLAEHSAVFKTHQDLIEASLGIPCVAPFLTAETETEFAVDSCDGDI